MKEDTACREELKKKKKRARMRPAKVFASFALAGKCTNQIRAMAAELIWFCIPDLTAEEVAWDALSTSTLNNIEKILCYGVIVFRKVQKPDNIQSIVQSMCKQNKTNKGILIQFLKEQETFCNIGSDVWINLTAVRTNATTTHTQGEFKAVFQTGQLHIKPVHLYIS